MIIPFPELTIERVAYEKVKYNSATKTLYLSFDDEDEHRRHITFRTVIGYRFIPEIMFDYDAFMHEESFLRTIFQVEPSPWIAELNRYEEEWGDLVSQKPAHFHLPVNNGVLEILAHEVTQESDQPGETAIEALGQQLSTHLGWKLALNRYSCRESRALFTLDAPDSFDRRYLWLTGCEEMTVRKPAPMTSVEIKADQDGLFHLTMAPDFAIRARGWQIFEGWGAEDQVQMVDNFH